MSNLSIKLEAAKRAIAFPGFHSDDLLEIALTDPCTLNEMALSRAEQDRIKRKYRTLAFMGDALIDTILADYLYGTGREFEREELDDYRQAIADRPSLTDFAIELGLPDVSSSWNRKNRKPPEAEPGTWGEMFEAVVGVLFLDADRNFDKVAQWLCARFIRNAVAVYEDEDDNDYDLDDDDYDSTIITSEDYAEMMGLSRSDGVSFT
ncbi:ribonuclease III domain-containing protein [Nodosilinea sp. AN01ver1]|uniref:ribonuclease III domain-containing protein n=1 Tax=Nodosilinea sp. AN01ver1 TaxID=3423362 RepID=UPI003D3116A9